MTLLINIKKNIFLILFFLILLIIGIFIFDDYGIYIDEDNSRENGFVSLKYLAEIFYPYDDHHKKDTYVRCNGSGEDKSCSA